MDIRFLQDLLLIVFKNESDGAVFPTRFTECTGYNKD